MLSTQDNILRSNSICQSTAGVCMQSWGLDYMGGMSGPKRISQPTVSPHNTFCRGLSPSFPTSSFKAAEPLSSFTFHTCISNYCSLTEPFQGVRTTEKEWGEGGGRDKNPLHDPHGDHVGNSSVCSRQSIGLQS